MKKIIGIAAVAAMVATSAFAGVNVGGWGRSGMNFLNNGSTTTSVTNGTSKTTTTDTTVVATPGWANGSRVGVNFSAASEDGNIGFNLNVDSNGAIIGIGDQAKIWGKIGWFEVEFGKIQIDDLRGSIGDWGNRDVGAKGEDAVFDRFYPNAGMSVELRPIDGLFIGAAIDTGAASVTYTTKLDGTTYTTTSAVTTNSPKMENVFKAINVGAGYTVKDTIQLKAAYFGSSTTDHYGKIDLGADLLMVKDNTIEIGVKLPMAKDNADGYFNAIVGIKGGKDKLSYKGHVYGDFAKGTKLLHATEAVAVPTLGLDAGAEYDVGICSIGGTAYYNVTFQNDTDGDSSANNAVNGLGIELYAKKGFSNGYLFAGVADTLSITSGTTKYAGTTTTSTSTTNTFYIPVGAEYWF